MPNITVNSSRRDFETLKLLSLNDFVQSLTNTNNEGKESKTCSASASLKYVASRPSAPCLALQLEAAYIVGNHK